MKTKAQGRWIPGLTLLAPIAWGTTYLTITELAPQDRPLLVAMLRVLPAGLVLVLFAGLVNRWRPTGREWGHTALLSLFNFGLFFPLLITAIYRLPGGVAASVGGTQPLLVVAISALFGVSVLRVRELVIGFLAVLGVALVVVRPNAAIDPIGVAAAVGANVSFSIGVVLTKKLPAPGNRMGATGWQLLLSSVVLAPLAIAIEGRPPPLTAANVVGIAYLSLIATGLAFVIWFNGIRRLPTQSPPLLGLAAPITGATLGWAVLAEQLSWVQIAGFVVAVSAIAYGATVGAAPVERRCQPTRHRPGTEVTITHAKQQLPTEAEMLRTNCYGISGGEPTQPSLEPPRVRSAPRC